MMERDQDWLSVWDFRAHQEITKPLGVHSITFPIISLWALYAKTASVPSIAASANDPDREMRLTMWYSNIPNLMHTIARQLRKAGRASE
mmetsp:Transcript_31550/g.96586  ORF Transcript_31550/g.96586 Transcript_31550/m.96586 type:complete len:89 (+) Transcript_31550:277-543(+)